MKLGSFLRLARAVPKQGRVLYCLYRDPRTPRAWKIALAVALGVIVTPFINIPEVIPVLGEMETAALVLLTLRIALARAPQELVTEHEAAIGAGTSYFHRDLERAQSRVQETRQRLVG